MGGLTIVGLVFGLIFLFILLASYRKSGPNEVLIITGGFLHGPFVQESPGTHSKVKVVKGGGVFVIPIVQQAEIQNMDTFSIDVDVDNIMTRDAVPVNASANAVLRVGSDPSMIATASEKILGLSAEDRERQMQNIVQGSLREALSTLTPKEANDRKKFADTVRTATVETFNNMGLEITALQITKLSDNNGYYESLYAKEVAEKQADATSARAEADARGRKAASQREKEAQEVELENKREIAAKQRDTEVAQQQYQKDINIQKAQTEQAYELESNKRKTEVNLALKETNDAKFQAEIVTKQKADSDARRIQIDVDKYQVIQNAQARAEQMKVEADANAAKITLEGTANADAQFKMAEALAKNQQAILAKAIIDQLPQIANSFSQAVANIDSLTVFDGSEGVGRQTNAGFVQSLEFIKQSTGIDIANIVDKRAVGTQTIDAKINDPSPFASKVSSQPKKIVNQTTRTQPETSAAQTTPTHSETNTAQTTHVQSEAGVAQKAKAQAETSAARRTPTQPETSAARRTPTQPETRAARRTPTQAETSATQRPQTQSEASATQGSQTRGAMPSSDQVASETEAMRAQIAQAFANVSSQSVNKSNQHGRNRGRS